MNFLLTTADIKEITNLGGYRLFVHQRRKKHLLKLIEEQIPLNSSILDMGCANGDFAVELSYKGYNVHEIDFEKIRLGKAISLASKYKQKLTFDRQVVRRTELEHKFYFNFKRFYKVVSSAGYELDYFEDNLPIFNIQVKLYVI